MPYEYNIAAVFEARQGRLRSDLLDQPPPHPTAKGDHTEFHWSKMLEQFLPQRYRVGSGFAMSVEGECSEQLDIIVYDEHYTPRLRSDQATGVVAAESVYAVFEVKPTLNKENVEYAAKKLESVRKLKRTSTSIWSQIGETPDLGPKPIVGGLLTVDSQWTPTFGTPFSESVGAIAAGDGRLDIGCAVNAGSWMVPLGKGWETCRASDGGDSLIHFAMSLFDLLRQLGTVAAIDIGAWLDAAGIEMRLAQPIDPTGDKAEDPESSEPI